MSEFFDSEALLDGVDGDMEFLEETIAMLDEDSVALLEQIRIAVAAGDDKALVRPAHALKGMLGNFCAPGAEAAVLELEAMGRENRMDGTTAVAADLYNQVEGLRLALHSFLKEQTQ